MPKTYKPLGITQLRLASYEPPNWYTSRGALLMSKRLQTKNWPALNNWRFLTLTVDPHQFANSQSAYEYLAPRLRFFLRKLKRHYHFDKYVWKLEFQTNGWPHWHILIDHKRPIPNCDLQDLWGHGITYCQRANSNAAKYLLKYIAKDSILPDWANHYPRTIRFFQTSLGFWQSLNSANKQPETSQCSNQTPKPFKTIHELLKSWQRKVMIISRHSVRVAAMTITFSELFTHTVIQAFSGFRLEDICPSGLSFVLTRWRAESLLGQHCPAFQQ